MRASRIAEAILMSERRKHLEFLRKTAREAIWAGDYERALTLYDDGLSRRTERGRNILSSRLNLLESRKRFS